MQFLRDREIDTRDAKQGIIINDNNDEEKQYLFGQLGDETCTLTSKRDFGTKLSI